MSKELTYKNIIVPYDAETFSKQLRDVGISEDTINQMLSIQADDPKKEYHMWLHDDIQTGETVLKDGERFLQFSGIYITDGKMVLLEKDPLIPWKGYGMGGLLSFTNDPAENALNEISEETPLEVSKDRLYALGKIHYESESPKVPGVMSHRDGYMFLYVTDSLKEPPKQYMGLDNQMHDLIILPIGEIMGHEEVDKNFKTSVKAFDLTSLDSVTKWMKLKGH